MIITFVTSMANEYASYQRGDTQDLPAPWAKKLVAAGHAVKGRKQLDQQHQAAGTFATTRNGESH